MNCSCIGGKIICTIILNNRIFVFWVLRLKFWIHVAGVQEAQTSMYLNLVRKVGIELRALLTSVDVLVGIFPQTAIREVNFF